MGERKKHESRQRICTVKGGRGLEEAEAGEAGHRSGREGQARGDLGRRDTDGVSRPATRTGRMSNGSGEHGSDHPLCLTAPFGLCQRHQVHGSSPSPATPPPTPLSTRHHHSAPAQAPSTAPATSPSGDLDTPAATAPPRGDHRILEMHLPLLSNHQRWARQQASSPVSSSP